METQPDNQKNGQPAPVEKQPSTVLKVVVLIVLILLLIVGILLPIKLVPTAVSTVGDRISSFFTHQSSSVTLETDTNNITSDTPFKLSWSGTHETDGAYVLSYACTNSATLETSINQPNEHIGCGTSYFFSPNDNSIELTPISSGQSAQIAITLSFLKTDTTKTVLGNLIITVNSHGAEPGLVITTTPGQTNTASSTISAPPETASSTSTTNTIAEPTPSASANPSNGTAGGPVVAPAKDAGPDISVVIESIGYLDPITSRFVPSQYVAPGERAAVKFRVSNIGTKSTGLWGFTASLPSITHPNFTAYDQSSIAPGGGIDYTLGFDGISNAQTSDITITAALNNATAETDSANNTATVNIFNSDNGNNGQNSNTAGADLSVTILSSGTADPYSGIYSPTTSFSANSRIAVQFKVANNGTAPSGTWNFTANLPVQGQNSQYVSDYQPSLAPGQSVIMTLTFNNMEYQGANVFSVQLNPSNSGDTNSNDDQASITLYQY